ncbi:MAG: GNAT family N-acetyltransferase [Bellilinea sp.]
MSAEFEIVDAHLRDLGDLRRLENECFEVDAWPLVDLLAMLMFPGIVRLKAVVDGRLAGIIAGDLRRGQNLAWIVTLGVRPEYRRRGIARALLHACENRLPIKTIKLSVRRSNWPAIQLYENEGYRQVDVWKKYYVDGEDALVLAKINVS